MFHFVIGFISAYVIWRFVNPLPLKAGHKWWLTLVILLISQHHLIGRTFFGTLASPELPFAVLVLLGWLFGAFILLALFLLIKDGASLVCLILHRAGCPIACRRYSTSMLASLLLGSALLLAGIGVWQAIRVPEIRTVELFLPRLPVELDGFKIVQITDLHASRLFEAPWVSEGVDKANSLSADLILITGDLIDGTPADRAKDVAPLKNLRARNGVLAIPGNHEYYAEYSAWLATFSDLGLRMLLNEHVVITEKGLPLVIAGLTDRTAERIGAPLPDIKAALSGAPKEAFTILMDHQPRNARENAAAGIDLQLSGHTHGGQIAGIHLITQYANGGFVSGQYLVGNMQLYVGNGAGLWPGFPIRLGFPSEITLFVLRPGGIK